MPSKVVLVTLSLLLPVLLVVPLARTAAPDTVGPIATGPELDYQPAIIRMLPGGQLLVVFERINPSNFMGDLYVTFSNDDGATWSTPQPAVASALNERHPSLVQLGPNSFVLFYLLATNGSGANSRIHRATSSDGLVWTDQGALDLGWATAGEVNPHVIRQADGTLTMTYHRLSGPSYIAQSSDDGATWDLLRTQVSNGNAQLPRLAYRESDGLYLVAYQVGGGDMDIYVKVSPDPYDWNVPQVALSTAINSHDPQPIVLEDGTFFVVYGMTPVNYFDLFYRTSCDGVTWSNAVQVTNDPTHYDTQPHPLLHGTPGHVILTWSHQNGSTPYVDHDVYINTDLLVRPTFCAAGKAVEPGFVGPAGLLTYTLSLPNNGMTTTASLSDPIPAHTAYDGGLWASSGSAGYDPVGEVITWTGVISTGAQVTLTFRVSTALELGDGDGVTNTAWLTDGMGMVYPLVAAATIDALPPTSAILDPLDGQVISATTYRVDGVANDAVAGVSVVVVSVDGGPWYPALGREDWAFEWNGYADGAHSLRSQAVDWLGHMEVPGTGVTVTVDTTPPTLLAHSPASGAQDVPLGATVVLTFSEPLVPAALVTACAPDPGEWFVLWNAEATVATLSHADFAAGQTVTFTVLEGRDPAGHPLEAVTWSFVTEPRYAIYLPVVLRH